MEKKYMSKRIESLDLLRAMAAVAVVIFHSSATMAKDNSLRILVASFLNWCVPIFLMITGALFLKGQKSRPLSEMIHHNVGKILIILVWWGFIYNFLSNIIIERALNLGVIWKSFKMVLIGDTSFCYQFWYLYVLVGLYILIPIVKPWVTENIQQDQITVEAKLFIAVLLLVSVFLPTGMKIMGHTGVVWHGAFQALSVYLLYLLLGHFLMCNRLPSGIRKILYVLLLLQGTFLVYWAMTGNYEMADRLTGYSSLFTCNLSVILFDMTQRITFSKIHRVVRRSYLLIAEYSLGVYIFHVMVLQVLRKVGLTSEYMNSIIFLMCTSVVTLCISTIAAMICKKIPILRKTL